MQVNLYLFSCYFCRHKSNQKDLTAETRAVSFLDFAQTDRSRNGIFCLTLCAYDLELLTCIDVVVLISRRLKSGGMKIRRGCVSLRVEASDFLEFFATFCFKTKSRLNILKERST